MPRYGQKKGSFTPTPPPGSSSRQDDPRSPRASRARIISPDKKTRDRMIIENEDWHLDERGFLRKA